MEKLFKSFLDFFKKYWIAFISLLSALVYLIFFIKRNDNYSSNSIKLKNDLTEDKIEIARLEGKREITKEEIEELEDQIKESDKDLKVSEDLIDKARKEVSKMDSTEKLKKFDDLGY